MQLEPAVGVECLAGMATSMQRQLDDQQRLLQAAGRLTGCEMCSVSLTWRLEELLRPHMALRQRRGLSGETPQLLLGTDRSGLYTEFGFECFELRTPDRIVPLVKVSGPEFGDSDLHRFWSVPQSDLRLVYRFGRRLQRARERVEPPVMPDEDRERLWQNTIGFLRRGQELLREFSIPCKRGVLLLGEPGNGKTTACRWLRVECERRGLEWRTVSPQRFLSAMEEKEVGRLFALDEPGVIHFDDFDRALWSRGSGGADFSLATFLTELDGIEPRDGVAYVFTSNARAKELDAAFRRPGRIDLVLEFNRPDAGGRLLFVETRWHADLLAAFDVDEVVVQTDGLSFAELEEVRKLLVLHFIDHGEWAWQPCWQSFAANRPQCRQTGALGFHQPAQTTAPCVVAESPLAE